MSERIKAIFENGVFRPVEPVRLPEGARVIVETEDDVRSAHTIDPKVVREVLEEIDRLPIEGIDDGATDVARNHDKYLYGEKAKT